MFPKDIRAALIDMDGVMYDSMSHHARAWHQMMAENGITTDPNEYYLYEGMTGAATINLIFQRELHRDATDSEKKDLYARKAEIFTASGRKLPMKGADRMVRAFMNAGIPRVLVTGSAQSSLLNSLDSDYPGAFPHDMRITANDVRHGKPDPEPYLMGAAKAGVSPRQCIVVENAPLGVRAGKAAGCFTVAVTTGPVPREALEKEGADLVFPSMDDFADWLERTLPRHDGLSHRYQELSERLDKAAESLVPATVTIVTDSNVDAAVLPLLNSSATLAKANKVVLTPGEDHKNLDSVAEIWNALEETGATRHSLVVNIGGGLVTDIGGFAAATFKRGIRFINVPTTLLGAVDAATGGKTGINFNGLKNEIGAFHLPSEVIISALPLASLSRREVVSGYAEMLKTGFIADADLYRKLLDVEGVIGDNRRLEEAMKRCVEIKEDVVAQDPTEKGLRKILNFGHTAGHAFESLAIERHKPLAHGEAVAHGMLVELILSHILKGFESSEVNRYASCALKPHYPRISVTCDDIPLLISLMAHDKKNAAAGHPNFTLLLSPGNPVIDCVPEAKDIEAALEIYRDMMC
ncbi:MAG: 3-dehydroquinate synthase [Muribaculaceae bacterium]|nr:3-dehydroquinate synthase [Muribaculaceae bacterium]